MASRQPPASGAHPHAPALILQGSPETRGGNPPPRSRVSLPGPLSGRVARGGSPYPRTSRSRGYVEARGSPLQRPACSLPAGQRAFIPGGLLRPRGSWEGAVQPWPPALGATLGLRVETVRTRKWGAPGPGRAPCRWITPGPSGKQLRNVTGNAQRATPAPRRPLNDSGSSREPPMAEFYRERPRQREKSRKLPRQAGTGTRFAAEHGPPCVRLWVQFPLRREQRKRDRGRHTKPAPSSLELCSRVISEDRPRRKSKRKDNLCCP